MKFLISLFLAILSISALAQQTSTKLEDTPTSEMPDGVSFQVGPGANTSYGWSYPYGVKLSVWSSGARNFEIANTAKGPSASLAFRTYSSSSSEWMDWKEMIYKNQDGFVGIGVNSPEAPLDVRIDETSGLLLNLMSDKGISDGTEEHRWTIKLGRSYDAADRTLDFGMVSKAYGQQPSFYVAPKGQEVFRISEDGKTLLTNVGGETLLLNPDGENRRGIISSNFQLAFIADKVNTLGADKKIHFGAGGETPSDIDFVSYMLIDQGNIGIGTTHTSDAKLTVNGDILASEVRVESIDNGPDYVFEELRLWKTWKLTSKPTNTCQRFLLLRR